MPLTYILASVVFVSLLSLVGVLSLSVGRKRLQGFLTFFVAFASGSLLTASFMHLIPESHHELGESAMSFVLFGIILFFIFEKFIHWHHCGKTECHVQPVAYLNLVADGFHNFIDGVIIAAAYLVDVHTGIIATIAIALHEIPQEFGDFSILIHSGMKVKQALTYNFLSATTAIIGAVAGYVFLVKIEALIPYAIAIASGGFIYIATADLMPELHKEASLQKMIGQTIAILLGVIILVLAFHALPHH
ncbi:MAG TPA: ZIP family metal transporter [Candidatus Altiarchaeales archaeon]|nr:ZIP family metal transporter [Candidatus Altiarchaeales archaeon]